MSAAVELPPIRHPQLGEPVAVYPYRRASGDIAFVVCRFDPKDFRPAQLRGDRVVWNLHGAPVVPYRLPELEQALAAGETIWITDGEKDAEALAEKGVAATCCARAQSWSVELAEQLTGARRVRIVADRDESGTGLRQAVEVRDMLVQYAAVATADVEIVEAAEGKDAFDHLAAGLGLHSFRLLLEEDLNGPITDPGLEVVSAVELMARPESTGRSLLGDLVRAGNRIVIVGDTGHGKTTLSVQALAGILTGGEVLGQKGAGEGPVVWIDLEQGIRSIKRGLAEAGLDRRDDVLVIPVPDGLALDSDRERHYEQLAEVFVARRPSAVLIDPYYKAHRADDPNAERPIIDLMRRLDALRAAYGFALILPAHPRKDLPGREGARKLTLHDVAGSGAATRGAEVVLAIERLSHGYGRLRILKDRDGDLEVGEVWPLLFDRERGFRLDPKEEEEQEALEARVLADVADGALRTVKEWTQALGIKEGRCKTLLEHLLAAGRISVAVGAPGRKHNARCFGAAPEGWEQQGAAELFPAEAGAAPAAPAVIREPQAEEQQTAAPAAAPAVANDDAPPAWSDAEAEDELAQQEELG